MLLSLPLVAALVVFALMSRNPKMYKSSSTIYTGIVSGYDVLAAESTTRDWMSVNNAVDNLISVITAESTLSNVSMRLLARNISHLDCPDEREYMTENTAAELRNMLSDDIIELTVHCDEEATYRKYNGAYEANRDIRFKQMFH